MHPHHLDYVTINFIINKKAKRWKIDAHFICGGGKNGKYIKGPLECLSHILISFSLGTTRVPLFILISYTIVEEGSTFNNSSSYTNLVISFSVNISPLNFIKITNFLSKLLAFVLSYLKAYINRDFFFKIISLWVISKCNLKLVAYLIIVNNP